MGNAVTRQEAFWEACGFGDKIRVQKFIGEGIDVNWVSYTHNSCAIHIASQGKKEIVQMLLNAGCNVNARDDRDNLALHHAAMRGHADICQMLIDAGSDINGQDKNGWTPLIVAAYFCQPAVVETLIFNNSSVNVQNKDLRTALHETCRSQSLDEDGLCSIAKSLMKCGADVNSKSSDLGEADFTPLMFCAYHGHPLVAKELIQFGCDVNAQGSNLWTALHWACDRNHPDVVNVLLLAGIDRMARGRRGELAVDRCQNVEIRKMLVEDVVSESTSINGTDHIESQSTDDSDDSVAFSPSSSVDSSENDQMNSLQNETNDENCHDNC